MKLKDCHYCKYSYLAGDEEKCSEGNKPEECEIYDLDDYFKKQMEEDQ